MATRPTPTKSLSVSRIRLCTTTSSSSETASSVLGISADEAEWRWQGRRIGKGTGQQRKCTEAIGCYSRISAVSLAVVNRVMAYSGSNYCKKKKDLGSLRRQWMMLNLRQHINANNVELRTQSHNIRRC